MSCTQVTACQPVFNVSNLFNSRCGQSMLSILPAQVNQLHKDSLKLTTNSSSYQCTNLPMTSLKLTTGVSRYKLCTPVCLYGGKGKSGNDNEASPWKALEKAMGSLKKEQSLEEVLRQQIEKQEYSNDGGSGGNPPGGGGDGSGGSEDEGLSGFLDELLQVILATIGFIFLYVYIIEGEEITVLVKDYIKFLFGAQKSFRLKRTMSDWGRFYQRLIRKEEVEPYWLESAIISTPTWWDSPTKYKVILQSYLESTSDP